mgnify:CR=1 FL=1
MPSPNLHMAATHGTPKPRAPFVSGLAPGLPGAPQSEAMIAALAQGREILMVGKNNASHKNEDFWEPGDLTEFQALLRAFIQRSSGCKRIHEIICARTLVPI